MIQGYNQGQIPISRSNLCDNVIYFQCRTINCAAKYIYMMFNKHIRTDAIQVFLFALLLTEKSIFVNIIHQDQF